MITKTAYHADTMTQAGLINSNLQLPLPDDNALKISNELRERIVTGINKRGGKLGFDHYMRYCLYEPGLGYYSSGARKIGPDGDFITAPEISPVFSKCLANQCAEILDGIGSGCILELGAGTGKMAVDMLAELERQRVLPEQYFILEISADLKRRQQQLLKDALPCMLERVTWLDSIPEQPFTGIILANEVLDALPVKRFKKKHNRFYELKVKYDQDSFQWTAGKADRDLQSRIGDIEAGLASPIPNGYTSELNTELHSWLNGISAPLNQGIMLLIDYGYHQADYYHPEHSDGTLLCHYRHHVHADPFFFPGLQDITVSVNFTALAECADSLNLAIAGYTTQTCFLIACGLDKYIADINALDIKAQVGLSQQVRKLTMPEQMGERFKVMALSKNYNKALTGFSFTDCRSSL